MCSEHIFATRTSRGDALAQPAQCGELRFAVTEGPELLRAFKTPSLRNVAERAPYMHAGQIATLSAELTVFNELGQRFTGQVSVTCWADLSLIWS